MLPSPYTLLAAVLLAVGSFGLGGYLGYDYARGQDAQRVATVQQQALVRAVDNAIDDKRLAVKRARENALAQRAAEVVFVRGLNDAYASARDDCDWSPGSYRLLLDAIDSANGDPAPGTGGVSGGVRGDAETDGALGPGDPGLGAPGDAVGRRVSAEAPGLRGVE